MAGCVGGTGLPDTAWASGPVAAAALVVVLAGLSTAAEGVAVWSGVELAAAAELLFDSAGVCPAAAWAASEPPSELPAGLAPALLPLLEPPEEPEPPPDESLGLLPPGLPPTESPGEEPDDPPGAPPGSTAGTA
ncbi:hypothetical protein [Pseudonocardia spinosispora]|uniref:hypothetical protein n=1 Tax=Pseudonocardia spinosispora TaxID=103441 RepID=UPI0012EB9258|nr:hypothetical protein [Pseudonocardia spinosispora]